MKKNYLTIATGLLLLAVFVLLLVVFQVRKSEVAVVTTFGAPSAPKTEPGAYLKFPWPIQSVHKFDQRIQNFEDKLDESQTGDSYILLSSVYVGWKISDAQAFLPKFPNNSIQEAERKLEELVRSAKTAVIGLHPLSDFVSTDEKQLKFSEIEADILKRVQDQLKVKNYGMEMQFLGFKKLEFPESVTAEVFKRMTSERQIKISDVQSDGERASNNIVTLANSKSAALLVSADAEAIRIKSLAQREAKESFAIFEQNPELAKFLLSLGALESSLKDRATLIFDQYQQPFTLFQGMSTNLVNQQK